MIEFESDKGDVSEEGNELWNQQVEKAFSEMFVNESFASKLNCAEVKSLDETD